MMALMLHIPFSTTLQLTVFKRHRTPHILSAVPQTSVPNATDVSIRIWMRAAVLAPYYSPASSNCFMCFTTCWVLRSVRTTVPRPSESIASRFPVSTPCVPSDFSPSPSQETKSKLGLHLDRQDSTSIFLDPSRIKYSASPSSSSHLSGEHGATTLHPFLWRDF